MLAPNYEALIRATATAQEYSKDTTDNENVAGWEDIANISDTFVVDNSADDYTKDILEETALDDKDYTCQKGLNSPETGIHGLHDSDMPKYKPVD